MKRKAMALTCLLVAVIVTAYSVCGTYAKYVSSFDNADEARVAKWNFSLDKDENEATNKYDINIFGDSYSIMKDDKSEYTYVVSSEPGIKVVAPGTSGTYGFTVSGTAETNYTVSSSVTITNNVKIVENGKTIYNPIRFSLDGGKTWKSDEQIAKDLADALNNQTADVVYPANYVLDKVGANIQWKWAFEKDENGKIYDENGKELTAGDDMINFVSDNVYDTQLASQANNNITVSVSLSVTQSTKEATVSDQDKMVPVASFSKGMLPADKALLESKGFDVANISGVSFNGKKLTGVITKNDSTDFKTWWNDDATATGYYYPFVVKAEPNSEAAIGTKKFNMPASGEDTFIIALSDGKDVEITVNGESYIIDCSELIFR